MKDLSTVTSSQSPRQRNGSRPQDEQTDPRDAGKQSECWLQTPKNQRKAAAAASKSHVYLYKEAKSPGPGDKFSSEETRQSQHVQGPLQKSRSVRGRIVCWDEMWISAFPTQGETAHPRARGWEDTFLPKTRPLKDRLSWKGISPPREGSDLYS